MASPETRSHPQASNAVALVPSPPFNAKLNHVPRILWPRRRNKSAHTSQFCLLDCLDNSIHSPSFGGKMAAMLRRLFAFIAVLSAMIFLAVAACGVRQHFASDQFHIYRWDPSTRSYSEIYIGSQEGSFGAHCESTKALASDNTAIVQWRARPSNMRIVHDSFPPGWTNEGPLVWGDHYYSTPSFGINRNGLSECWTLEFRLELALIVFAALPGLWGAVWLRRRLRRLSLATRGFAVVADSATGAVDPPQAAEMMPSRSPRM